MMLAGDFIINTKSVADIVIHLDIFAFNENQSVLALETISTKLRSGNVSLLEGTGIFSSFTLFD